MPFEIQMLIFQISRACSSEIILLKDTNTAQHCFVYGNDCVNRCSILNVSWISAKEFVISFENHSFLFV